MFLFVFVSALVVLGMFDFGKWRSLVRYLPFFGEGIFLFAFIFFLNRPRLLMSSLSYDEILAWEWESGSWVELFVRVLNDTQQILYYAIVKLSLFVIPVNNDYWIRMPSLVLGSSALLGIFYYIRKDHSWLTALFFAVIVIPHPLISYIATYNRPYALLLFLMSFNLCVAYKLFIEMKSKSELLNWLFLMSAVALGYVHYLGLFYLAGLASGLVVACGLEPIRRLLNSTPKRTFVIVGFSILLCSFLYQLQFRDRLSWVFEARYSLRNSLWDVFGYGGIFLLGFFYRIDLFKNRSATEKLLSVGLLVSLSLMCIFGIWVDRYMIILMPFSLWLSSIYFEKFTHVLWQSALMKRYALLGGLAVAFVGIMQAPNVLVYFEGLRLGDLRGVKNLLTELKRENIITDDTKVLCITYTVPLSEKPMEQYSKMYWKKDICTNYSEGFASQNDISKYQYVIHLRSSSRDVFDDIPGAEVVSKRDLLQLRASENYELYRVKEVPKS